MKKGSSGPKCVGKRLCKWHGNRWGSGCAKVESFWGGNMVKGLGGQRLAAMGCFLLAMSLMAAARAQSEKKAEAKSGGTRVEDRMARIEQGLAPIDIGKGQTKEVDLAELMKLCNEPGLSVAAIDGYKIAWAKAYGTTELGGATPVTTKTLFQAGSISKPVA